MKTLFLCPRAAILALGLLAAAPLAQAQTGVTIGAITAPDASAALDIISTTKGVLLPRVASAAALAMPAAGLLVYQTGGPAGFYYNAGTSGSPSWQQIATMAGAVETASNGLTKTGQNIALGGSLTGATTLGLGANNLLLSSSGGRVGIGTVTPLSPLSISQVSSQSNTANQALGELSFVGFNRTTTSASILAQSPGWDDASHLILKTSAGGSNAQERLRVTADGNVGINTTAPTARLDVDGGMLARGNGLISNQGAHLQWNRSGGGGETWLLNQKGGGAGGLAFGASDNVSTGSNTVIEWGRFDQSGHLRLGTSGTFVANTPGPALEWAGPSFNTDAVGLYRHNATAASTELRVVVGDDPSASVADADRFVVGTASASAPGQLSTASFTPQFTVQGNGNVGIGTTAPAYKLEVNGTAAINTAYDLLLRDANHGLGWYGTGKTWNGVTGIDGPTLYGYNGGMLGSNVGGTRTTALAWNNSGQVGLGTTAPAASAQVEISSTTRGFLPPRLSQTQRDAIGSPAEGLTVFNTDTDRLNSWNGTAWTEYIAGTTAAPASSVTYTYTGGAQAYTVPAGMTLLKVTAVGGGGGRGSSSNGKVGGQGGSVTATIPVTPGETLNIYVGGQGGSYVNPTPGAAGGYNGGGSGVARFAGGGGGGTDIRRGTALTDRLVVAGGGGASSGFGGNGGSGGNPGLAGANHLSATGGGGGTQSAGGAAGVGGNGWVPPGAGTLGQGGAAGTTGYSSGDNTAAGGGGGYYGGGGGAASGAGGSDLASGGGGSSWATPAATGVNYQTGGNAGNGSLTLVALAQPAPAFDGANIVNIQSPWSTSGSNVYRADGNVGIGTSSPGSTLEVRTDDNTATIAVGSSSGEGGALYFGNSNHGVKRNYSAGNDVGLYTTAANVYLSASGPGNVSQFILQNNGNVGIGGASPGQKLYVNGTICASGGLNCTSDGRYKRDVVPVPGALASVLQLRGVYYYWKQAEFPDKQFPARRQLGFIAQEIEPFYPEMVSTDADGYKSVDYSRLTPVLVEALKEQQAQIKALQARAVAAEAQAAQATATLETFEARLRRLEAAGEGQAHR